ELQGAALYEAKLQGAALDKAELQGAALDGAKLQGAALDGAKLQGASLVGAELQGASQWGQAAECVVPKQLCLSCRQRRSCLDQSLYQKLKQTVPARRQRNLGPMDRSTCEPT